MRRLWLLALLAPAAALAQVAPIPSAGQITFPTVVRSSTDGFINVDECTEAFTIALSWRPETVTTTILSYQLFAANDKAAATGPCDTTGNPSTGLVAGSVGPPVNESLTIPMIDVEFSTSSIATAAGKNVNGVCASLADEDINLCIQAKDAAAGGNNVATARGKLTLSRSAPAAPTSVSAGPGENALIVRWDESTGSPLAEYYRVVATTTDPLDPAFNGSFASHESGPVTATNVRLSGLTNGVAYTVRVFPFSTADNVGQGSDPPVVGTPEPVNDFWETYKADGGREQGGCGTGPAGPLALLAAASLLALLRRRK